MAQQYDEYGNPTEDAENPTNDRRNAVGQWYRQYLGREGSAGEINSWLGNPNFGSVEDSIRNSAEAQTYAAGPAQQPQSQRPIPAASAWNREVFRDAWMGTGTNVDQQNQLLQQYGLTPDAAGRVTLPGGDLMDLRYGAKAGINRAAWTGVGPTAGSGNGGSGGAGGSGNGVGLGKLDPRVNSLYEMLLGRAQQGIDVNRDDPAVRAQADAYAANAERARRNYLADLAEKSGPLANLQGDERVTAEQLGQSTGAFEAQLMAREMTARRDEIQQALQSMQGLLTTEQQMALQKELSLLDDATRRLQIDQQGRQFDATLGFQYESLDQQLLRQLLGSLGS